MLANRLASAASTNQETYYPLSGPVPHGPRCNLFAGVHSGILPEFRLQRARAGKLMMAEITGGDVNGDFIAGMSKLPNLFLVQIDVARPQ
jgi:hypothetical protein